MNLQFMKRSHVHRVEASPLSGGGIALVSPAGFGMDGRAAACTEVRNSNLSGERE